MKTSLLIVSNRPSFVPWMKHQIEAQTRKPDEVVVVTNAADPSPYFGNGWLVYHQPQEGWVTLGYLRQKALDLAANDIVVWMDDDDWYHPKRLEVSVAAIKFNRYDAVIFPLTHLYFTDDETLHEFPDAAGYALPAFAVKTEIARKASFAYVASTEERQWMNPLLHGAVGITTITPSVIPPANLYYESTYVGNPSAIGGIVIVHGKNTWKKYSRRYLYNVTLGRRLNAIPPKDVSAESWKATRELLEGMK